MLVKIERETPPSHLCIGAAWSLSPRPSQKHDGWRLLTAWIDVPVIGTLVVSVEQEPTDSPTIAERASRYIDRIDRNELWLRDEGVCGICQEPVEPGAVWHMDHIVPLSRGGTHTWDNVQVSHPACKAQSAGRVKR